MEKEMKKEIEVKKYLRPIMLAGTGSDVGKSVIATGLCRIFLQDGYHPAPFKAQNMALNSFVTPDGLEIGRAQAVQAEAAGVDCSADMNPLLLKPSGDRTSQVVLNGRPIGNRDAYDYFRKAGREELREAVCQAFDRLSEQYNPIVMEGAGSISELNLADTDLVNMPMARHADAAVILVADIDRGGVFASAYGSIALQTPDDRKRIKGIIVNKFRGDMRLFEDGRRILEKICGVPVLGVVPYFRDVHIDEEDSVALGSKQHSSTDGKINVAVVLHPHISNFTDFSVLERQPNLNLFYTTTPKEIEASDIVILPGSKSTIADLDAMRQNGAAQAVLHAVREGKTVVGICGGYQMMGLEIADPDGVEGRRATVAGLGILPVKTILTGDKRTVRRQFRFRDKLEICDGYEIHVGKTEAVDAESPVCFGTDGINDGYLLNDNCFGTYMHGILDNPVVIESLLSRFSKQPIEPIDTDSFKQQQFDLLASHLRDSLDMKKLYEIMTENV